MSPDGERNVLEDGDDYDDDDDDDEQNIMSDMLISPEDDMDNDNALEPEEPATEQRDKSQNETLLDTRRRRIGAGFGDATSGTRDQISQV
jgi:hypothetical protein